MECKDGVASKCRERNYPVTPLRITEDRNPSRFSVSCGHCESSARTSLAIRKSHATTGSRGVVPI